MTNNDRGERIRNLRSHLGLSLAAFGAQINISPTHIKRLEKSIVVTSDAIINNICLSFNVDRAYFDGTMDLNDALALSTKNAETGFRLKEAREERGWTQKELAKATGVVQPAISNWEAGAKLTKKQGRKLADILEVGFDWLMEGDERNKYFPVDEKMIEWLKDHEEVRREIWKRMMDNPE